jgi:DNA-binding MarR family transcriptional regulator
LHAWLKERFLTFYQRHGEFIFGTRLRRISEKFLADVSKIYKTLDIPFETGWYPIFFLLNKRGRLSITEIAKDLEITHSAVSQMVGTLEINNLVCLLNDKNDKRRRLITFSEKGRKLMDTLTPIWKTIRREMEILMAERDNSAYLLVALDELEESFEKTSVYDRVMNALKNSNPAISK